jgi:GAF domain-containing protein
MASSPHGSLEDRARIAAVRNTGLSAEPDVTMDRLAALVGRLLDAEIALVSLVDDARQFFPGQRGLDEPWSTERTTPISESICSIVVERGAIVQIDDASADPHPRVRAAHGRLGVGSYLGAPLRDADGNVLGSLCAIGTRARSWTDDDRQLLADLAFGASSELQARIAKVEAEQTAVRIQLLAEANRALNASLDIEASISRALDIVVPAFTRWSAVVLAPRSDARGRLRVLARHADRSREARLRERVTSVATHLERPREAARLLHREDLPRLITMDEIAPNLSELPDWWQSGGSLVAPITWADAQLGAWLFDGRRFGDVDRTLAADLGLRAGAAVHNANAFAAERSLALALQEHLLPTLPEIEGLSMCGTYMPASDSAQVGGDWYDVLHRRDGVVGLTVGDVSGHAVESAAAMGRISTAVRCYVHDELEPDEILAQLDGFHHWLLGGDDLATCLCATLRRGADGGWLGEFSNAGHLPPLVVSRSRAPCLLTSHPEPLVGAATAPMRTVTQFELARGDLLVLYTDGLIERRREPLDRGLRRLLDVAALVDHDAHVDDVCARIVSDMQPAGDDDIAVLCVRAD